MIHKNMAERANRKLLKKDKAPGLSSYAVALAFTLIDDEKHWGLLSWGTRELYIFPAH